MDTLKNFVIDAMIVELNEMEDREIYGADLGYEIFETANCNGSYTCDAQEAKEFIKDYFESIGEVVEDIKFNLGAENIPNPFTESERFQVVIMLEISSSLIAQVSVVDENWNNEFTLTKETLEKITKELEEMKD
jgi:hypothetical protein